MRNFVASVTSPSGYTTTFQYDAVGNLASTQHEGLQTSTTVYDHSGNLLQSTDATGVVTKSVYDVLGRLRKTGWGDGTANPQPLHQFASARVRTSICSSSPGSRG